MKYASFFFLLLLTSFVSSAQDNNSGTHKIPKHKFQIGVNFSPDICYRDLKNNNGSQTAEWIISARDEQEKPIFGFTAGLNACYELSSLFSIEAGVQYSRKGYKIPKEDLSFFPTNPNDPVAVVLAYRFNYVDIPVKVNILLGKKKLRFIGSVGVVTNFLIDETNKATKYYNDDSKKVSKVKDEDYEHLNFSPMISAGVDYRINSRMNLRAEPTFRYGIMTIRDAPITGYLYNAGLNIGYYVRL